MAKPVTVGTHVSSEAEKSQAEHEPWSQMMHWQTGDHLGTYSTEEKEEREEPGDEEEPPGFESAKSQFGSPGPSEAARTPLESSKSPAEPSKSVPSLEGSAGFQPRTPKPGSSSESGKERRTTSKEILSSSTPAPLRNLTLWSSLVVWKGKTSLRPPSHHPAPTPHGRSAHSLQPIDCPPAQYSGSRNPGDRRSPPARHRAGATPKEPEKTEEFQWPQRSQTLGPAPS